MKIALVIGIIFLANCPLNAMQYNNQKSIIHEVSGDYCYWEELCPFVEEILNNLGKVFSRDQVNQSMKYLLMGARNQPINGGFDEYDLVEQYHAEDK